MDIILARPVLMLKWQTQPVLPWVRLQAPISPTQLLTSLALPTYLGTYLGSQVPTNPVPRQ